MNGHSKIGEADISGGPCSFGMHPVYRKRRKLFDGEVAEFATIELATSGDARAYSERWLRDFTVQTPLDDFGEMIEAVLQGKPGITRVSHDGS